MYLPMYTKHTASISGIAIALGFVMLSSGSDVLAQQQTNNTVKGSMMAMMPNGQQMSQNSNSMRMNTMNLNSSVSLFSPVIDAIKSKIHTTLNDATTNALKAVGGGSNSSAVAAFIHPERGFLVYNVFILDTNDNIHRVIVDPGNGKVLSNQPMSLMAMMVMMAMMHPSMGMMGGPGMGMMDHGMMMQHGMMGGPGMMDHGMGMMGTPQNNPW
jgi:uncharacterized membrane protein YkoI